jgi:hypothetical protein
VGKVEHSGRCAACLADDVHERFFRSLGAGVGEEGGQPQGMHRELLQLVEEGGAQVVLRRTGSFLRLGSVRATAFF